MAKKRLDILLVEKGLVPTMSKAQALILAGVVYVDGNKTDKSGVQIDSSKIIEVKKNVNPYVSRGGLKLEHALKTFNIDVKGKVAMDVGASTGGFTDCLLQNGVKKVYAIDVGYGQLDFRLRNDEKVINIERQNIRYLEREKISDPIDVVVIDVSFISLTKVIPNVKQFLKQGSFLIALIKPQFEVGKGEVGKGGVVREKDKIDKVVEKIKKLIISEGFQIIGVSPSPILGPKGNQEQLLVAYNKAVSDKR